MPIKIRVIGADALVKIGMLASEAKEKLMGELVRASQRFGLNAVQIAKDQYLSGPRPDKLGVGSGRLRSKIESKTERSGSVIKTSVGTNVIYGPTHEMGGETHPSVTNKMRKFAWAMFFKSGDDKWKRMALTKKSRLKIKIPARPFLRPAINDAMPSFEDNIGRILSKISFTGA